MFDDTQYVDLPDKRLEDRLETIVKRLSAAPEQSIPQALNGNWAETKAAYRFLKNERVTLQAILEGQRQATLERLIQQAPDLELLVQDTATFDFKHYPATTGLGPLENKHLRGFLAHSSLAVTPGGVPLGILAQEVWVRAAEESGKSQQRHQRSFVDKESYKWVRGLKVGDVPLAMVTVCDREADIYEFMDAVLDEDMAFVVRARHDRSLADSPRKLYATVRSQPVADRFSLEVKTRPDRPARLAALELRFGTVQLQAPKRAQTTRACLTVSVIEVVEPHPPQGEKALHWVLLTSLPIENVNHAHTYVTWYSYRWLIERFHFVLKSGCRIEEKRLSEQLRLERFLGIANLVAGRLLWLTYEARKHPDAPCTVALSDAEWRALVTYYHQSPDIPDTSPTLRQAVRLIAQLGGFLGRKGDGEPGVKVLWRGWQRLRDITATWLIMHPPD
jgi:hypothetical protein